MISSEVSLGKLEPGGSSGGAVEGPTAIGMTGELLWTWPEGDKVGRSGQGGPKAKPTAPAATGPTSAAAAVCGILRLAGQQTLHAGMTIHITPAWPTTHSHWDRWVAGGFPSHT